jgi:long-chain acyl-CoA synthetase
MAESQFRSVVDILHYRVKDTPDREGLSGRRGSGWFTWTWGEVGRRSRAVACGLRALGVAKGDRVGILAMTRPEWIVLDMGILSSGCATTTIYTSNTPEECRHILADSGAVMCFVENAQQAEKLIGLREALPGVRKLIWVDGEPPSGDDFQISLAGLAELGEQWDAANPGGYDEVANAVGPEDLATLIYTSGTTGLPKGVMLTHANWVYEANAIHEMKTLVPEDKHYLFLPLAHSFAKVLEVASIRIGVPTAVDGSIDDLVANLGVVRPTVMAAVPRVFEKVYNKVLTGAKEAGGAKYAIFTWAVGVGREVSQVKQKGGEPGGLLAIKNALATKLVFSKLQDRFGGRIRFFVSGGAPLSREIAEFFHAAGLLILEGYGLTESSAASFVNRYESYKFGTVGPPVPGTLVKIAEDGEILIKGGGIMTGYYNLPEASAEALSGDGWLHTGDIGEVDSEGFLKITDRKKDLIVTAGGKNVAPQYVENLLKSSSPFVSQVVMLGDKRPYCIALITVNEETVGKWAAEQGLSWNGYAGLSSLPEVKKLIEGEMTRVNGQLARYEQVKKIEILPREFSVESGEMTPKMSIKRKVVQVNYEDLINTMYGGEAPE